MSELPDPFLYRIPKDILRCTKKNLALAWKSDCPGIILQVPLEAGTDSFGEAQAQFHDGLLNVHLVHEPSGCILVTFMDYGTARKAAKTLAGLPINFSVPTAQGVYLEVSKLTLPQSDLFYKTLGLSAPPAKVRKQKAEEYAKNYETTRQKWVSEKRPRL